MITVISWAGHPGPGARHLDGLSKDISDSGCMLAEHVGVDAQRHGRVSVAKPGGDDMNWNSGKEQRGRVQMAQIVQAGVRECLGRGSDRLVVFVDQYVHQRGHGVGVKRLTPSAGENQAIAVGPRRSSGQPLFGLLAVVFSQYGDSFAVDADDPGLAALGGSFNSLAVYHGS
jgi:hypothetical protein